ncbi:MAG: TolB family protein, partial [Candidatus Dormibacteria bacterium]
LALMALFGFGVYSVLGTLKSNRHQTHKPTESQALIALNGSVVMVQQGKIYRLNGLTFTQLQAPAYDWVQVEPAPTGDILAVALTSKSSDVYLLNSQGQVLRHLLSESSSYYFDNHWAYYPRLSPNGQTLFFVSDWYEPSNQYNVDFQIQSVPFSDPSANPTVWSQPLYYQGGDVEPIPLSNGDVIYAKYYVNSQSGAGQGDTYSDLVLASAPNSTLVQLTTPQEDCAEPALSPNGTEIAMICTDNSLQTTTLDVASWNGTALGPLRVVASGPEPASPTWSPDGKSLLYFNTLLTDKSSPFQLWWVPQATAAKPGTPQQVTAGLDFTATSPPIWSS